jgi:hypothetical protein
MAETYSTPSRARSAQRSSHFGPGLSATPSPGEQAKTGVFAEPVFSSKACGSEQRNVLSETH